MLWRQDTSSPYPPNRLLQTEAFLNIRKVSNSNMHKLKLRHFNKLVIEICIIFIVIFMINLIIKIKTITVGQNLYTFIKLL